MTTSIADRAAKARAGKARKYQERLAEKLREAGWEVKPPESKINQSTK